MVWWPVTGSTATSVQVAWKVIRKEPSAKVYRSTAVYLNRCGGAAVGNAHDAATGLKLWHSIEPVVEWPNTPPEAVISPVHGPFAWKTSASVMVTSWGGVATAGATSASTELCCAMRPIHYAHRQ